MKRTITSLFQQLFLTSVSFSAICHAEVVVPSIISDHMVLQQGVEAPIWGTSIPGDDITVSIDAQVKTAKADKDGKWMVRLSPLKKNENLSLTIKGVTTIVIRDVLVGEVWLGSGQSNMLGFTKMYTANDDVLATNLKSAPFPKLRLLRSEDKGWMEASPENLDKFSALLYSFGFSLQKELNTPLGIIVGAVGGTPSGYWLTEKMLNEDQASQNQIRDFAKGYSYEKAMEEYQVKLASWKIACEKATQDGTKKPFEPEIPRKPGECKGELGSLYRKHISSFVPYAIRGILWDQGEGGTGITGLDQYHAMGALINGWRREWAAEIPFVYMQKPSGGGTAWNLTDPVTKLASPLADLPGTPPGTKYGLMREDFLKIARHPNTTMVATSDLGGETHPKNKSGYGSRAARVALGSIYNQPIEYSGPTYASFIIQDHTIKIHFTHVGKGLASIQGAKLQGFAIAGEDRKFFWGDATIENHHVVVTCPAVPLPKAVRYAWGSSIAWANLFNVDGLPAPSFRTDEWP